MVEPLAQHLEADAEMDALGVAERLSQAVGSKVAVEASLAAPSLHHAVEGLDGQGLVLSLLGSEQVCLVAERARCEESRQC